MENEQYINEINKILKNVTNIDTLKRIYTVIKRIVK